MGFNLAPGLAPEAPQTGNEVGELSLRTATEADLDELTQVAQAGFPDDPEWNYRFPNRRKYPEDNWKCIRREYEEYLAQPEKYVVLVVTAPVKSSERLISKVIALAVWDISILTKQTGGDSGVHERRDANPAHMEEFARALDNAFIQYFDRYGGNQIHLWLLTTHPKFRRLGAGRMLCNWGLNMATRKSWVMTVMASPMGKLLYEHLGYRLLGSVVVQVGEEKEKLNIACLVYEKSGGCLGCCGEG
ncbi:MAG: hypothetical protein Q9170_003790 [Blastenia crenularia]